MNHIKQHGYNVTTEIVGQYDDGDIEKCRQDAIEFSIQYNIVESTDWANLEVECVDGFGNMKDPVVREKAARTRNTLKTGIQYDPIARMKGTISVVERQLGAMDDANRKKGLEKCLSEEVKQKRKNTFLEIGHGQGEKNSQFGTMWITDGTNNKKVKKDSDVPYGWRRGRI